MCKQTVTQHLAKRDSRLPAYGSVVLQIFYFMKAFTRKNEFVMSYYFLFIIAQNIFNYCLLYSQRIERSMFLLNCLLFPIIFLHRIPQPVLVHEPNPEMRLEINFRSTPRKTQCILYQMKAYCVYFNNILETVNYRIVIFTGQISL